MIQEFTVIWLIVAWSYKSNKFHSFCLPSYKFSSQILSASYEAILKRAICLVIFTNTWKSLKTASNWMTLIHQIPFWSKACNEWESKNSSGKTFAFDFLEHLLFGEVGVKYEDPDVPYEAPVIMTGLSNNGKTSESQARAPIKTAGIEWSYSGVLIITPSVSILATISKTDSGTCLSAGLLKTGISLLDQFDLSLISKMFACIEAVDGL